MTFKSFVPFSLTLAMVAAFVLGFTGCASLNAPSEESQLSAAGFRTQTPSTPKQLALYNSLPAFHVERHVAKGHVFYVYADKKNEVVYFGDEKAYQRYRQLGVQESIADDQLLAAEMNEESAMDWGAWGPIGFY